MERVWKKDGTRKAVMKKMKKLESLVGDEDAGV
jgi:hypothetical protein